MNESEPSVTVPYPPVVPHIPETVARIPLQGPPGVSLNDQHFSHPQDLENIQPEDPQRTGKKRKLEDGEADDTEPPKKRRKRERAKKKRDPNAPKRPQTAYLIYYRENVRDFVKQERFKNKNGNVDMTLVSKELGRQWKDLTEEEKQKFRDKYEKQKQKYEEELTTYNIQKKLELSKEAQMAAQQYQLQPQMPPQPLPPIGQPMQHPMMEQIKLDNQPNEKTYDEVVNENRHLRMEKQGYLQRMHYIRQSFEKLRQKNKQMESDLSNLYDLIMK